MANVNENKVLKGLELVKARAAMRTRQRITQQEEEKELLQGKTPASLQEPVVEVAEPASKPKASKKGSK